MKIINSSAFLLMLMIGCGSQVVLFPYGDSGGDSCSVDCNLTDSSDSDSSDEVSNEAGDSSDSGDVNSTDSGMCMPLPGAVVNLGTAGNFAVLAKSGISTVPNSSITGDIGVSPIAATAITGFSLILDSSNTFSTSAQVTGKVYAADYSPPTPVNMTTAVSDMETAFTDAAGRAPSVTELGAGNIGGMTLSPGVYKWSTGLLIPTNVTLKGSCSDVWIFEIAQNLTMNTGTSILLSGGAQAKNIFWQVSGAANLNTNAHLEGVVLTQTAATLGTKASVNGRLLAQTAVTLDQNQVVQP